VDTHKPTRKQQLAMLQKMYEIRYFDQTAGRLYQKGMTKGGIHAYIGQEAIAVGISAHLTKEDKITSTHRGHGHHIAKGADLNRLMAEVLGKATGYCAGRGGSMHVAAFDVGSLGAFPINAAGVPSAVGAALSAKLLNKDYVVVAYFGEGALGQGTLHECMNLAAIWKLALIFVCENNQYAVSTHISKSISLRDILAWASTYGIFGEKVDGQNVLEVYDVAGRSVERTRQEREPSFIYAETYRFEGHYIGEPQVYRTQEEVLEARKLMDPIKIFCEQIISERVASEREIADIENIAKQNVSAALKFAEESPEPAENEYSKYVYI
jgi:TPP-dependent pyruvate/acetoin dehydrogenase alpha subunit